MTVRHLEKLFEPKTVAVIGASFRPNSANKLLTRNLLRADFKGELWLVNRNGGDAPDRKVFHDVADLPAAPDLAVVSVPAAGVAEVIDTLGARGTRAAIVISAGMGEGEAGEGSEHAQALAQSAARHDMRIVGPSALGLQVPPLGLDATMAPRGGGPGRIAFLSQSGAMMTAVLDWAAPRGIGFSHLLALGAMSDVDIGDCLDYLATDPDVRTIVLYVEQVNDARKFVSAARIAARNKQVFVIRGGWHREPHESDLVYDEVFRRTGLLRVANMEELFDAVETLALAKPVRGDRLAIVTNGQGPGFVAADHLTKLGGRLARFAPETEAKLAGLVPRARLPRNPVDVLAPATAELYADVTAILAADPGVDGVLVLHAPSVVDEGGAVAKALVERVAGTAEVPILTCWLGSEDAADARALFRRLNVPSYETPDQAVDGFMHMATWRANQRLMMETPPRIAGDTTPNLERARGIVGEGLARGVEWLGQPEACAVLDAFGIRTVPTRFAATPDEIEAKAAGLTGKLALKLVSPDIARRGDVGGVLLDLPDAHAAAEGAAAMLRWFSGQYPQAEIEGFEIQPMVEKRGAHTLFVTMHLHPVFGPVMAIGQGGPDALAFGDIAVGLPPLNLKLAREQLARTQVYRAITAHPEDRQEVLDGIALTLIRASQIVVEIPEVQELIVNPLLAAADGTVALTASMRIAPAGAASAIDRLAIRPYPKSEERTVTLRSGREILLRPVRPEDEPGLQETFEQLDPEDVRLRFLAPMRRLSHQMAARLAQIDYDREMAFIAEGRTADGRLEGLGIVRLHCNPDLTEGEYAIVVRSDQKGQGLGWVLMERIIGYAHDHGLKEVYGEVLRENHRMIEMCRKLGFRVTSSPESSELVRVVLDLDGPGAD